MKTFDYEGVVFSLDGIITNTYTPLINITTEILRRHEIIVDPYFFELFIDGGHLAKFKAFYLFHQYKPFEEQITNSYY